MLSTFKRFFLLRGRTNSSTLSIVLIKNVSLLLPPSLSSFFLKYNSFRVISMGFIVERFYYKSKETHINSDFLISKYKTKNN